MSAIVHNLVKIIKQLKNFSPTLNFLASQERQFSKRTPPTNRFQAKRQNLKQPKTFLSVSFTRIPSLTRLKIATYFDFMLISISRKERKSPNPGSRWLRPRLLKLS